MVTEATSGAVSVISGAQPRSAVATANTAVQHGALR